MASYNRVFLMGNLTREVEVNYTQNQTPFTELGLAVNQPKKNSSGSWEEQTTFFDVSLFGESAEYARQTLGKGSPVMISGKLRLNRWNDKESGQPRQRLVVIGETIQLVADGQESPPMVDGPPPLVGGPESPPVPERPTPPPGRPVDDDLPF
tara:strand:- start:1115 stop:1570 length:456 start_codon:yes stop_codon:yes gene_type:complete